MPCERQGKGHRRMRMSDVMRCKQESGGRIEALSEMRRYAYEGGSDDLVKTEAYLAQFDEEA